MDQQQLSIAGNDIAFIASEGTGRAVLLVHGNSSSARVWQPLLTGSFGQRFRCLALDLPGHGRSAPARHPDDYSLPGYAAVLAEFARKTGAEDAVIVGWSLGGHIALEAAAEMPEAAGFVVFGTPPVGTAADFGKAFLPNPAVNVGFTADVDTKAAESYAGSFLAPGSVLPTDELVADILATDGTARTSLFATLGSGGFADEVEIVAQLTRPIAVLHGEGEQLVSLDYLRGLAMPTLWRGAVQLIPGVGHAPQVEAPENLADILTQFITDLCG
ncbi:alpha/beta hydrolase [Streptosporangium sp. NBC_01755]|uniref:alpha/beta fold hydrolase n=1 Tax=unclassified Streptosporangium TaxID=2632669 RepID=UPI002DD7A7EF|nr:MULTISPECIES: alpha/beta hydrolase [unclassified Streptosporangium]WSA27257.1 alpha/beta hydrolase [Streptosporangium sp. NBC_01810]WSD01190.1 alpha/beta hydrolase [Streptosporangium sp. NBC_01755]